MIKVNLLQIREELRRAAVRNFIIISSLSVFCVLIIAFTWHSGLVSEIDQVTTGNARLRQQVSQLKSIIGDVEKLKAQKDEMEAKKHTIQRLELDRKTNVAVLNTIEDLMPSDLWLDKLSIVDGILKLTGKSVDNQVIGKFFTALEGSPIFENLVYGPSKQEAGPGGLRLFNFELECTIGQLTPDNFVSEAELEAAQLAQETP